MIKNGFFLLITLILSACGTAPMGNTISTTASPALLASNNNTQCHQELMIRLSEWLAKPVIVSANVFSTESRLLLEETAPRQTNGMYKDGLSLAKPKVFTLQILNQQCLLKDEQNQQIELNLCVCQSISTN